LSSFYVTQETISERAELLLRHARELLESGVLPRGLVDLRERRISLLTEGYFLLNRAYKDWRLPGGHFTERPKIAALQCVTISRFQPFFPSRMPVDDTNVAVIKCNEIFACSYALGILETEFTPDTPEKIDFWLRVLNVITSSRAETLEPYITNKKMQIDLPLEDYDRSIHSIHEADRPAINSLVCIFELLSDKRDELLSVVAPERPDTVRVLRELR
jgi:hypothetical protein